MANKKLRHLHSELKTSLQDIKLHQLGKITLRAIEIRKQPRLKVNAALIRELREKYNMSRSVFALKLRVSLRTLEKWEQGQTTPNDQAAALILMLRKYPDTLKRLEDI